MTGQQKAIINGQIVLPDRMVVGKVLLLDEGKILGLASQDELGRDVECFDAEGAWVTPGLVDIHIHGAQDHSFNIPTNESYEVITRAALRQGVTALLATLTPDPIPHLVDCLDFCKAWMEEDQAGSQIVGAYLEGPFINPSQKGALDANCLFLPGDLEGEDLFEHLDVVRIMALAPELPGALDLVSRLSRLGVVPAAGHSNARDGQVLAAMERGLRHVTHIWSGMSSTTREGPWRRPGLVEASLAFDGLQVEMIADEKHLPDTLMKLAYKCIGPERLCIISDASPGAGLPEGAHYQMGSLEYEVSDGVGMLLDHSAFAGSTTLLGQMLPILVRQLKIPAG